MVTAGALLQRSERLRRVRGGAVPAFVLLVAAVCLAIGEAERAWLLGVVAVLCTAAVFVGIRRHRPARARPWWCLFVAAIGFTAAIYLRSPADGLPVLSFVAAMCAYTATTVGIVSWIRDRRSLDDTTPLIDATLIVLGMMYVAWILVLWNKIESMDLHGSATTVADSVFTSVYPALDSGLLTVTVYLLLSTGRGNRSLQWISATFAATLAGDSLWGLTANTGLTVPAALPDTMYVVAFLALALAASDPSMRSISKPVGATPTRGSQRYVVVLVLLCVCSISPLFGTSENPTDIAVRSVLLVSILVVTFVRGERALGRAQRSEIHARYEATHDLLTGLPNRSTLAEKFDGIVESARPDSAVCILFVDLDSFKMVNDSYGHRVGDELIAAVGRRIRAHLGPGDFMVRYAGDEFIVLSERARPDAELLARSLIDRIAQPFELSVAAVYVTATVGIAGARFGSSTPRLDDMIREADTAMYHAKSRGPARYAFYDESLRARSRSAIDTATALRGALERDEFEVHYQPIVDTRSRRIFVFEALVRWNHQGTMRFPGEFIPIAESLDLIGKLGEWVLDTALADLVVLRRRGFPTVTMSVNVSALQLRSVDLPDRVAALLERHGLRGSDLALEVTESTLIDDPPAAEVVLERLADMGVLIVLDDFGIGYSSLSRLRQLPIAILKIDRSFVAEVAHSDSAKSLIAAIVAMSDALPIRTVAEGVETEEQAVAVENLKVRFGQGYLYGRPAPVSAWLGVSKSR